MSCSGVSGMLVICCFTEPSSPIEVWRITAPGMAVDCCMLSERVCGVLAVMGNAGAISASASAVERYRCFI